MASNDDDDDSITCNNNGENLIGTKKSGRDLLDTSQHSLIADTPNTRDSLHMACPTDEELAKIEEKKKRDAARQRVRESLQEALANVDAEEALATVNPREAEEEKQEIEEEPKEEIPSPYPTAELMNLMEDKPREGDVNAAFPDDDVRRQAEREESAAWQPKPKKPEKDNGSESESDDEQGTGQGATRTSDALQKAAPPAVAATKPGAVHVSATQQPADEMATDLYNSLVTAKSNGKNNSAATSARTMRFPNSNPAINSSSTSLTNPLSMPDLPDELMPMPMPLPQTASTRSGLGPSQHSLPGAHRGFGVGTAGPMEHVQPLYKGGMNVLGREASRSTNDDWDGFEEEMQQPPSEQADPEQPPMMDADVETAPAVDKEEAQFSSSLHYKMAGVVLAVVVAIAVVAGVVLSESSAQEEQFTAPTPAPTMPLSLPPLDSVFSDPSLLPNSTREAIESATDTKLAQVKAYQWLIQDSNLQQYGDAQLRQRFALATFYYATNGPNWLDDSNSWLDYQKHECEWFSLSPSPACPGYIPLDNPWDQHFEFHSLVLSGKTDEATVETNQTIPKLRGSLVPEMSMLTSLVQLDISHQKIGGTIPTELSQLSSTLLSIYLNDCFFTGTIPDRIYEFPQLLFLNNNPRLEAGTIPTTVGLNTHLARLHLVDTNLNGTLPTQLGLLSSSALLLDVKHNNLKGQIPTQIGQLTKLQQLLLDQNSFTGGLPTSLARLSGLIYLEATKNPLHWQLVPELFRTASGSATWPQLRVLSLDQTFLQGTIPSEIGLLASLEKLDLHFNQLQGQLPSELGLLTSLSLVKLTNNDPPMEEPVPQELCIRPGLLEGVSCGV